MGRVVADSQAASPAASRRVSNKGIARRSREEEKEKRLKTATAAGVFLKMSSCRFMDRFQR